MLMIRPQSCTATILFIFTIPVSVSTETSAITAPPTPLEIRLSVCPPPTWLAAVTSIGWVPSRMHASFHDRLRRAFHANGSAHRFQLSGLCLQRGRDPGKERLTGMHGCAARRRTHATNRGAAAGTAGGRILSIADLQSDLFQRQ